MVRKHSSRLIAFVGLVLLLGACTGDPERAADTRPTVVHDPHVRCSNSDIVFDDAFRLGGQASGDIDGDGSNDKVWIALDPDAEPRCKSFLGVDTGASMFWASTNPDGEPRTLERPSVNTIAIINDQPGSEVVLNLETGASTQFVGVFTLGRAGIELMGVDGKGPSPFAGEVASLIPFGGSVGHLDGVDCSGDLVAMSSALPSGDEADAYDVETRYFAPLRTSFSLVEDMTERLTVETADLDDTPTLSAAPFGSCD
jgi:hypothetical protein